MTPEELKEARRELGLSGAGLAALVGAADGRTVRKWEAGDRDIPAHVEGIVHWKLAGGDDWLVCAGADADYVMRMVPPRLIMEAVDTLDGGYDLRLVAAFDPLGEDAAALARLAREGGEVWAADHAACAFAGRRAV